MWLRVVGLNIIYKNILLIVTKKYRCISQPSHHSSLLQLVGFFEETRIFSWLHTCINFLSIIGITGYFKWTRSPCTPCTKAGIMCTQRLIQLLSPSYISCSVCYSLDLELAQLPSFSNSLLVIGSRGKRLKSFKGQVVYKPSGMRYSKWNLKVRPTMSEAQDQWDCSGKPYYGN